MSLLSHNRPYYLHPAPAFLGICLAMAEGDGMDDELRQALALSMQEV